MELHPVQRPGLLLNDGMLFLGFSGSEDKNPYHGWLFAYDTTQSFAPSTNPAAVWCSTCGSTNSNYSWGGIWQSGAGIATDGTYIYVQTGNGAFYPGGGLQGPSASLANSFVKLGGTQAAGLLEVQGTFTPAEGASASVSGFAGFINDFDLDLSVSGVALIGGGLALAGSKEGKLTLVDTNAIQGQMVIGETPGEVSSITATCRQYELGCSDSLPFFPQPDCARALAPRAADGSPSMSTPIGTSASGYCGTQCSAGCGGGAVPDCQLDNDENGSPPACVPQQATWPHIHGTPIWWAENDWVYVWGQYDYLRRYTVSTTALAIDPTSIAMGAQVEPSKSFGGILSLSKTADGSQAIVWASGYRYDPPSVQSRAESPLAPACTEDGGVPYTYGDSEQHFAELRAYDARTMDLLWNNESGPPYTQAKFVPPTIANGKVYLASNSDGVIVYEGSPDPDDDGIPSSIDNCAYVFNPSQLDTNVIAEATVALAAGNPVDPNADGHVPGAGDPLGYGDYWHTACNRSRG